MKRVGIVLTVAVVVLQLCCDNTWARPTTQQEAEKVVNGWLKATPQPLGTALGLQIKKTETYTDNRGSPLYYIVYLQPNGFVIVSADDSIEPIIGFAQDGIYDPSPANPLAALVTGDLNGRIESARAGQQIQTETFIDESKKHRDKWGEFTGLADASGNGPSPLGVSSIDDVRVAPLVQTAWNQTTCCSDPNLACYNYYTPSTAYDDGNSNNLGNNIPGDPNNYWCGCVATALAQIMYYHQYPNTGIGKIRFTIRVWDSNYTYYTRGGDGAGGPYDWADMVLGPGCNNTTDTQRKAIGALCYDAGVGISNLVPGQYTNYDYPSGETTAYTYSAKKGLMSTFKYGNAIYGYNGGSNITDINGMVNSNLDAGLPVFFGIMGSSGGHAVVCDGYGYNAGTPYHHLNLGWGGVSTAWYNLPDINSWPTSYNTVYETIYNIFPLGSGETISGRVTDPCGNPISDVNVYGAVYTGGQFVPFSYLTGAKGIYAFYGVNSETNYAIWANKPGYVFPSFPGQIVQTGHSTDSNATSGNLWGVNIVCIGPDINTMTPTSGPGGTYMKIEGTYFGSSPGQVIFPGVGYYGDILQWSDTQILCRVPFCPSGDVVVQTAVGVNSPGVYFDITNPTTIYVDVNHTPDVENGTTDYPFSTIERGIYATGAPYSTDTIIVNPGTYKENIDLSNEYITLTSTDPNDPCIVASTIIDGNSNGAVVTLNNSCSVLTGFTITDGNNTVEPNIYGGGIYCNGQGEDAAPVISHCIITRNSAGYGGGIYCNNNCLAISNCLIAGNSAWWGGGIDCNNGQNWYYPTINSCLIVGNSAYVAGGIYAMGGSPVISHCDISSNITDAEEGGGGGILCEDSNLVVRHTILWADTGPYGPEIAIVSYVNPSTLTIRYSDVQGGLMGVYQGGSVTLNWDANSVISADPLFVRDPNPGPDANWGTADDDYGDLHLREGSPCIDAGDPNFALAPDTNTDMDGQPRVVGCRIDIGADEFVYLGDINFDGDVNFADFAIFAGYWLDANCGKCGGADLTGDGIVDVNDLAKLAGNWLKSLCRH